MQPRGVRAGSAAITMAVAASLVLGACGTVPGPGDRTPDWTTAPSPTPQPTASLPATVDGLPVMTVSELQAARAAGKATGGPFALRGYWSMPGYAHSCPAPPGPTGELEMYCVDSFGITELDEQAIDVRRVANMTTAGPPKGPLLLPYVSDALWRRLELRPVGTQPHVPVPIVVTGHFDDPRAADCRPEARQRCLDRFVLDEVVVYDPAAVGDPTPAPTPTPFPYDDPPPAPFELARCAAGPSDPTPVFAFVGWMPGDQIPGGRGTDYSGATLYVAITLLPVPLGEWSDSTPRWRPMGRLICIGFEGEAGAVQFDVVRGTEYREFEDGTRSSPLP